MAIQDRLILGALNAIINKINKNIDMGGVFNKYNADERRTMVVHITDLGENSGFSVIDGRLQSGTIENPTCVVFMTKSTLAAIITGKMTHDQAFLLGQIEIRSESRMRDSIVLTRILNEMKAVGIMV